MIAAFATYLFVMLVGHSLADYPLQGDYLAKAKDRGNPLGANGIWIHALGAHSLIHGGFVTFVTGHLWMGVCETIAHALTDFAKTEGKINYHADQAIHLGCKIVWAVLTVWIGRGV